MMSEIEVRIPDGGTRDAMSDEPTPPRLRLYSNHRYPGLAWESDSVRSARDDRERAAFWQGFIIGTINALLLAGTFFLIRWLWPAPLKRAQG